MFKNKFFGVLLGIFALILIPSVTLAQNMPTVEELDTSWDTAWDDYDYDYDWDDTYDSLDDSYDAYGDVAEATALAALVSGVVGLAVLLPIGLAVYIYVALAYSTIAKKLDVANSWFAWIPILNVVLMFQIAGMSGWFILLTFVPVVNIVVMVLATMKTCEKRGLEKLLGLLMLVPIANFILLGMLAWKKDS